MNNTLSKYLFYYPATVLRGEKVYPYLKEYRNTQYLSPGKLKELKAQKLRKLLKYVKSNSSYYQNFIPDNFWDPFEVLDQIPYLSKQDLIKNSASIQTPLANNASRKTTGGSTGEPVILVKNADALARERAITWRCYEWAGVSIGSKQARFWGVPHSRKSSLIAGITDVVANRKRFSAFELSEQSLDAYIKTLVKYRPDYLYGYTSVIEMLAEHLGSTSLPSLKSIITTSEVLTDTARQKIENSFKVKVFDEYGCGEVGSIAHECEHQSMHTCEENLIVECNDKNELVVTDLHNFATPLIRYKVGDFAERGEGVCKCGRTLTTLKGIHGRAYDCIITSSGKKVHPEAAMYVFEDLQSKRKLFKQVQLVQRGIGEFDLNVVKSDAWGADAINETTRRIEEFLGEPVKLAVHELPEIKRESSGKMRVIKNLMN